jgi:predicted nucleic acid-binding protein
MSIRPTPKKRTRATEWLEFYWNAVRKMRLDSSGARQIVTDLWQWRPVDMSPGLIRKAWQWMDTAQLGYWDALIVTAAERFEVRYLLSQAFAF